MRTLRFAQGRLANELVEWFNAVDATYRSDLRELNELNFARFDAKLELRVAEVRAEMQAGFARADAKLERRIAELRAEMQVGFARLETRLVGDLTSVETRLTKRMFYFWIGQAATTAALVFGAVRLASG